jgi:hypothetical protein
MLSKEEELKLEYFTKIIKDSKEDKRFPPLGAYDMEWLADKLKKINDELKEQKKLGEAIAKFEKPKEPVEFPSPLTVQYKGTTRIVAIWETDRYVCSWCGVWFTKIESSKSHGFRHLRVVDPEDAN